VRVELPGLDGPARWPTLAAGAVQLVPVADPGTHTVPVRVSLPAGLAGVLPGSYARLWVSTGGDDAKGAPAAVVPASTSTGASAAGFGPDAGSLRVPLSAVVRRAELTAVYVLGSDGRPSLRQVRLGEAEGDQVRVLAGLREGDRVLLQPQRALAGTSATR